MTDDVDDAQAREEAHRRASLARTLAQVSADRKGKGRMTCPCGDRIPAARRKAVPNAKHCVPCQQRMDRLGAASR